VKGRVLIVEDEVIVAEDLEWQLTHFGCEVVGIAASGQEALSLADQKRPEIVIMDIQLQGRMNGIEAADSIRRSTGAAIIFVTAFPAVFVLDPRQMQPPGVCLTKPFSPLQLKTALQSVLAATGEHPA
jgi:CheY-like chemotaxis protein